MRIVGISSTLAFLLCCSPLAWSQGGPGQPARSNPKVKTSGPGPAASGRYLERASVLVTSQPACFGQDPWREPPNDKKKPALHKGWQVLAPGPITRLPSVPKIDPSSGSKVELYIYRYTDNRGLVTGPPQAKVAGNRIVVQMSEDYAGGPKTPVFEPSLWFERVTVNDLGKGVYDVYLHSTPAGKISVP